MKTIFVNIIYWFKKLFEPIYKIESQEYDNRQVYVVYIKRFLKWKNLFNDSYYDFFFKKNLNYGSFPKDDSIKRKDYYFNSVDHAEKALFCWSSNKKSIKERYIRIYTENDLLINEIIK